MRNYLLAVFLGLFVAAVPAQTAMAQSPAAATDPAADEAFAPLRKLVHNLYQSLVNKGGVEERDHAAIRRVLERVREFSTRFPKDHRSQAMELQLAVWLGEKEQVEAIYRRMLRTSPDDVQVRISYATMLKKENRYDDILSVLDADKLDPAKHVEGLLTLSEALFAEHHFQEAVAALEKISSEALEGLPHLKLEYDQVLGPRKEYVQLWDRERSLRDAEAAADDLPRVMLITSRGPILLELFENEAPNTVANFISLVERGFYDGTKFHRVIANFMAQGGDPNTKGEGTHLPGQGNPGYFIPDEHDQDDRRDHFTGSLAMAKPEPKNTGGCQFFLTHLPTHHLNGKHTVFGRVMEGLDIARSIKQDDVIQTVTVLRKRPHDYQPQTLPLTAASPTTGPASIAAPSAAPTPIPTPSWPTFDPPVVEDEDEDDEAEDADETDQEEDEE